MLQKKRKDLFQDQLIIYEDLNSDQKNLFLKILAHDFGSDYSSLITINGNQFKIRFQLENIEEKNSL